MPRIVIPVKSDGITVLKKEKSPMYYTVVDIDEEGNIERIEKAYNPKIKMNSVIGSENILEGLRPDAIVTALKRFRVEFMRAGVPVYSGEITSVQEAISHYLDGKLRKLNPENAGFIDRNHNETNTVRDGNTDKNIADGDD